MKQRPNLFLLLDYDGTLAPIVSTPEEAVLPPERKQLLYKLSTKCPEIQTWIITGRLIDDIRRLVGIDGVGYSGNHGLEIKLPDQPVKEFYTPEHKETILTAQALLKPRLSQYKGVLLEYKGPILAIHYRLAETGVEQEILRVVESICSGGAAPPLHPISVAHGKKVIELRTVPDKSKGTALEWIKENVQNAAQAGRVYIGDDVTDEDAFKALSDTDVGVFIGKIGKPARQTAAKYYLLDVDEVWDFLLRIYNLFHKK